MNCREIFEALSDYLDDDLHPDACDEIEQHLNGCAPCLAFLNTLQRTVDFCRDTTVPPLSGDEKAQLRESVKRAYQEAVKGLPGR
jgi:RNA polymerase sigma-70 factor (ECF subfamily)